MACAVRSALHPERREDLERADTEALVVELRTVPVSMVVTVYCPPGDSTVLNNTMQLIQRLVTRYPGRPLLVVGDFNVPDIKWRLTA